MKQVSTFKLSMNLLNTNNCKSCFYDSSAKCPCCQDHEEILDVHRTVPFETMIIGPASVPMYTMKGRDNTKQPKSSEE
jgi:hypothetical protein